MKRWLGWTIALGLGGALATGCVSRQEEGAKQVGTPSMSSAPQPLPRERRPAPLGVGGGPDNARRMAMEQLEGQ